MEQIVRSMLKNGIRGTASHLDTVTVFDGLEYRFTGLYPTALPNTIWQVAQHMHLWVSLKIDLFEGREIMLPKGHGFSVDTFPPSEGFWEQFRLDYKAGINRIGELIDKIDLAQRYPVWGNLTAAEIVEVMVNHNSYHAAQVVAMRRVLGVWKS